ncbi:MAG: SUMF1/EgtB/PvdO family nonheme iron enzyme [Anaerolineae bacterium]|nr:SUMF1/EgtB/PvdO family nonheme iron enzyme [Anaerolineae bacterium]
MSYSRSVKAEVGAVIKLLRAAGHEVWWDGDIPTIADWWATILENIEHAEIMLFMVSEKSVQSPYCLEELRYGIKLNRPVLPFILDNRTKYSIPPEFGRRQWYVHDSDPANMLSQIVRDCSKIPWEQHQPRSAPRPPEPNSGSGTLTKQFQQAVSLAEAGQFAEAISRFNNVSSLDYAEWGADCDRWIRRVESYAEIADLTDHKATLARANAKWNILLRDDSEAVDFDPLLVYDKLNDYLTNTNSLPPKSVLRSTKPSSFSVMPQPFAWIDIPSKGYSIAKYPITNAQYSKFIDANGYNNRKWWTDVGWKVCQEGWHYDGDWKPSGNAWAEPRYWKDTKWNGGEQPVVGVSWYEAVAFCFWLTDITGEKIILPTEEQWQYAAQGDHGVTYPWGSDWDCKRCNNSVRPCGSNVTTPVRQYEGKGDSPFGIVDMVGNVWEWCLTDYEQKTNDVRSASNSRVLRGGSWFDGNSDDFRCDHRRGNDPIGWDFDHLSFRVSRS